MAYMTCVAYMDFFIIFLLFYFILSYHKFSKSYFLAFWAWGNGPPPIWKENQQNFEKEEILFLQG